MLDYLKEVLKNCPTDWLTLTTHRLDIYNESLAKTEFLEHFQALYEKGQADTAALNALPTAYDYIRLGHPLSSVLEWAIAKIHGVAAQQVISFASQTMPILAILRKNVFDKKSTQIVYTGKLPQAFDAEVLRRVYGYDFELKAVEDAEAIPAFEGTTIFVTQEDDIGHFALHPHIDFYVSYHAPLGSILLAYSEDHIYYTSDIQHVRRRETIAMTPANCYTALEWLVGHGVEEKERDTSGTKAAVRQMIRDITQSPSQPLLASSGLSMQYAIMMGLVHQALEQHEGKDIKIIVPPNCYGGTNDQARRLAAGLPRVEVMDLPVDGEHNMVQSVELVLAEVAAQDAVPYIIAEIPTNPRVEVPDLEELAAALRKSRTTAEGKAAIEATFILDQTFCPNVNFLGENAILSTVPTISYVSGSKFPSGGKCTAGYCVANEKAVHCMEKIEQHLHLCDNEATALQLEILAQQLPSMKERIQKAYQHTADFVRFIREILPTAKINFVSEALAEQGFTPSVFSLDLPTKGSTHEEREAYKRTLNQKLIHKMITEIPNESKYCVSYGQLKGCYWTIPATSTQGTTKEEDKDYIARVSLAPNVDLEAHKQVFSDFVKENF